MPRRPCYGALAGRFSESGSAPAGCLVDFKIKPDSCVACMACVRVCPADAVAVEGAIVRIVDEACTRCGLCLPACPHDAIEAVGDVSRALELALAGRAVLILSVECAVYFYPAAPNQVVNACYAAGFRTVHRGVLGDELVAREYLDLWADGDWGTMIRSTCPVIVETVRTQCPELIPYLAPVATPIAAEARYLKQLHGVGTPVVDAGEGGTGGGPDVDAAIAFEELADLFQRRGIVVSEQAEYFTRVPEGRRGHRSRAGGLPREGLLEETQASRRFRKVRGLGGLAAIARAVAVDRLDLGFVDILPCEGCLDHPLLGPRDELFRRREIVGATEPARSRAPVVEEAVARGVRIAEAFPISKNGHRPQPEAVDPILKEIGLAPNGKPWDCGACGYPTCRMFANAAALGRTTLRSCPPYLDKQARLAQLQAAVHRLTGPATYRGVRARLASRVAPAGATRAPSPG